MCLMCSTLSEETPPDDGPLSASRSPACAGAMSCRDAMRSTAARNATSGALREACFVISIPRSFVDADLVPAAGGSGGGLFPLGGGFQLVDRHQDVTGLAPLARAHDTAL